MKAKNILIVGILLLGFLAYIVSFEIPRSERKEAERKPFYEISKAQLSSLEVKRASEVFKLRNAQPKNAVSKSKLDESQARLMDAVSPNDWSIEGYAFNKIDSTALNAVITQLMAYELGEPLPTGELESDQSLYGLKAPEVVLVAERLDEYSNHKQVKFEFGKKSDFLAKRYVRYTRVDGSSDIFLTDDLLFFALNKPVKDFRRNDPVSFVDSEITKLELSVAGMDKLLIEKKVSKVPGVLGDRWNLIAPIAASADQSKVLEVLKNLKDLKAKDYLEGDSAKAKDSIFENPSLVASLYPKGEGVTPIRIKVVTEKEEEKEKTYFTVEGTATVFEAESNSVAADLNDVASYRQTKFFDIEVDQVQGFELGGSYVLGLKGEKKDESWKIGEKQGDEVFIRQWLLDLKDLKAQHFPVEAKDFGFSAPIYKLSVKIGNSFGGTDSKPIERVLIVGNPDTSEDGKAKTYYAAVDDLSEPFIITAEDLTKISPKMDSLLLAPTAVPTMTATGAPSIASAAVPTP